MTDTLITFDGGTPGSAVVAGSNGISSIQEGAPTYAAGLHGTTSLRAGTPTNTANTRAKLALGVSGNHYGSIYLKNNTAHGSASSSVNFFYILSTTGSFIAQFRARPDNALSIRVISTEMRVGTAGEIPVGSWFRLDWQMTGTTLNWRIFYNPEGTTPNLTGTVDTSAVTTAAQDLSLGANSTDAAIIKDWSFDTVRVTNTGTWFGPYSPPPSGPTVKVWNGTAEVNGTVTLWNGTSEVAIGSLSIA